MCVFKFHIHVHVFFGVNILNDLTYPEYSSKVAKYSSLRQVAAGQLSAKILGTRKRKFKKYQCICIGDELSTAILIVASCQSGKLSGGELSCTQIFTVQFIKIIF